MARGIDDGDAVLGLKLPQGDVEMSRFLSAFSLPSTQAYLKEPLPICGGVRGEECIDGEQPDLSRVFSSHAKTSQRTLLPRSAIRPSQRQAAIRTPTTPRANPAGGASPQLPPSQTSHWSSCLSPHTLDEVPGGGGLARVHVADDHDVDVRLLLAHCGGCFLQSLLNGAREGSVGRG